MAKIEIDIFIARDHVPIAGSTFIREYKRKPGEEGFDLVLEAADIPPFLAEHRIRRAEREAKAKGGKLRVVGYERFVEIKTRELPTALD